MLLGFAPFREASFSRKSDVTGRPSKHSIGEGQEVVIDGVYQLKLATTGQDLKGGHFHADGTWHEEDH